MTRSLRLEYPGAIWHLTSRGIERRDIYRTDRDRLIFLDILDQVVDLHHWIIYGYVLMSNHYHLLLETPRPTLSVGAKRLNGNYAQSFNEHHERAGHLFQGRFNSILVERETHFLELLRYIVLNPVRAGMVRFPGDYPWSSYLATAGFTAAPWWLATEDVLREFGPSTRADRCESYRRFVADGQGAEYRPWDQVVGQVYLGSDSFRERLQPLVGVRREVPEYPESQRLLTFPPFESIVPLVSTVFDVPESRLRVRSRHISRKALAQLSWHDCGLSFAAIGPRMNLTAQAAAYLARQGLHLEQTDSTYAAKLRWIRQQLEKDVRVRGSP